MVGFRVAVADGRVAGEVVTGAWVAGAVVTGALVTGALVTGAFVTGAVMAGVLVVGAFVGCTGTGFEVGTATEVRTPACGAIGATLARGAAGPDVWVDVAATGGRDEDATAPGTTGTAAGGVAMSSGATDPVRSVATGSVAESDGKDVVADGWADAVDAAEAVASTGALVTDTADVLEASGDAEAEGVEGASLGAAVPSKFIATGGCWEAFNCMLLSTGATTLMTAEVATAATNRTEPLFAMLMGW